MFGKLQQKAQSFYRGKLFSPFIIVVLILLANGLYITGVFNANPINLRSGLISNLERGPSPGDYTIDPSDGFYAQALGKRAAADLAHGQIPWWNHYEGVGAPLIGGMQSAALFPLQFLLGLANGLFYFHLVLQLIGGLATYYFLRRIGCHDKAALVGGVAFGLNGTFAWITHTIFNPIAFLPLMLLGIEFALQKAKDKQAKGWFVLAASIALTLYAGFPETGFINAMFAGFWALVRMTRLPKDRYWPYLKKLLLGSAVGLAVSLPLLIAFADYFPYANVGLHAASTANLVLPRIGLSALVMPYIYGPIFAFWGFDTTMTLYQWWATVGGFLSLPLVLMAGIGLWAKGFRRPDKIFLAAWIIFCIFASFGLLGFNYIAGNIPPLSLAAFCRYFPPTYIMAVIMLGAMGLTYIWDKKRHGYSPRAVVITAGSVLALTLAGALYSYLVELPRLLGERSIKYWFYGSIAVALFTIIVMAIAMLTSKRKLARATLLLIIVLDAAVMYAIPMFAAPRSAAIDTQPVSFLRDNLGYSRFYSLGPIQPNYGSYFKIPQVNINDIPQPKLYSHYITEKLDPNVNPITFTGTNVLDANGIKPLDAFLKNMKNHEFIGVKYLITFPNTLTEQQADKAGLRLAFRDNVADIYQLPNPKPYLTVLKGACQVTPQGWDRFVSDCRTDSTILRRTQFMPGWVAKVDGKTVPIAKHADLFQQIEVPAGKHNVTYKYQPPHLTPAAIIGALGIIAVGVTYRQEIWRIVERFKRLRK